MPTKIEISPKTILLIAVLIASVWFVVQVRDILFLLFIAFIIMSSLRPIVDRLEKYKIPRPIAIIGIYIVLISLVGVYTSFVLPPLITESIRLAQLLPEFITRYAPYVSINQDTIFAQIAPIGQNLARFTVGIFSNIIAVFTVLVFAFYFLLERNNLTKFLEVIIGKEWGNRSINIVNKSEERMGAWVRGQLLLVFIIGQASYIGLTLLGINYALPLALIAGVLELFPIIGPNIAAIPAILVALTISPGLAIAVAALYLIIQQVENNVIVPAVMKKTVGIPPLASLLALMIGGSLGGVLGIILSVPILLVIQTIITELFNFQAKQT